jgi:hypothetical protein|uniref:Uncharacterized protein n=1 Tax=Cyanidiaceae sp. MX-AZ01 TaxID=1503164 RepID=A0A060A8D9_9RHOD|nr:hypothetical protein [Cyanidiaceae sp. MX-AZ01]
MDDYYIFEYHLSEKKSKPSFWQWWISPIQMEHLLLSRQVQRICMPLRKASMRTNHLDYQFTYQFGYHLPQIHAEFKQSLQSCPIYYVVNPKHELILLSPRKWESEYQPPTFVNWVFDLIFHQRPTSFVLAFFHPQDADMYLKTVMINAYERDKNSFIQEGDVYSFLQLNGKDVKVIFIPPLKQMCEWKKFEGTPVFRIFANHQEFLFVSKKNAQQFAKKLSCKYDVISLESVLEADLARQSRCVLVPLS